MERRRPTLAAAGASSIRTGAAVQEHMTGLGREYGSSPTISHLVASNASRAGARSDLGQDLASRLRKRMKAVPRFVLNPSPPVHEPRGRAEAVNADVGLGESWQVPVVAGNARVRRLVRRTVDGVQPSRDWIEAWQQGPHTLPSKQLSEPVRRASIAPVRGRHSPNCPVSSTGIIRAVARKNCCIARRA